MTDVLIRGVPAEDLRMLRAAAEDEGSSLQSYLSAALHAHVVMLARRRALAEVGARLDGKAPVPDEVRAEVFEQMRQTDRSSLA
ncbi:MAG: hypothetical protein IPL93_05575 [Actinomycetales bacterium]|jgi:hypothetical protein|nr:hypothetical protein [Actinomycetales bacterium]HMT33598.1 hypothetical protein [Dermatophilaceae bacterium]